MSIPTMQMSFEFDQRFLEDHAGNIVTEPTVAIVELVANAYDAGATNVHVYWPVDPPGQLTVRDDGVGMNAQELDHRWKTICYDRVREQGTRVVFPPGVPCMDRRPFGRNGKGRFAPFCFSDSYRIETARDGQSVAATVSITPTGGLPFRMESQAPTATDPTRHGTAITASVNRHHVSEDTVRSTLASRFMVDPHFAIHVNEARLALADIDTLATDAVRVPTHGELRIHRIDARDSDKTTQLHGVSWWVQRRMVGVPTWNCLEGEGAYLDGRSAEARRFSFIIEADFLRDDVKQDWTGFHANARVLAALSAAHLHVSETLLRVSQDTRRRRKRTALAEGRTVLENLPQISRAVVGRFIDEVQERCPTLSVRDLGRTASLFAKFEEARSGYDLLHKLAECSPDDIDTWNALMEEWTASNARMVLNELHRRLELIARLQRTVSTIGVDELHELQPLFERGLWIFGPEYDAVDFRSNRGMAEVIGRFLRNAEAEASRRRPDIVATGNSTVGVYAHEEFGDQGEVSGYRSVLILELKTTGLVITQREVDQARDYAVELQRTGTVRRESTQVTGYVLGSELDPLVGRQANVGIEIAPMTYRLVLDRAHARTFNLQRRIQESAPVAIDADVESVVQAIETGDDLLDSLIHQSTANRSSDPD